MKLFNRLAWLVSLFSWLVLVPASSYGYSYFPQLPLRDNPFLQCPAGTGFVINFQANPLSGSQVPAGSQINYAINYQYNCKYAVKNAKITIDTKDYFEKIVADGATVNNGLISWSLDSLQTGDSGQRTFLGSLPNDLANGMTIKVAALIDSERTPVVSSNSVIHIIASKGEVSTEEKSDPGTGAIIASGETINYYLSVRNSGAVTLHNVVVSDVFYDNYYSSVEAVEAVKNGNVYSWLIPVLEPGESVLLTVKAQTQSVLLSGTILENYFTVQANELSQTRSNAVMHVIY